MNTEPEFIETQQLPDVKPIERFHSGHYEGFAAKFFDGINTEFIVMAPTFDALAAVLERRKITNGVDANKCRRVRLIQAK